MEDIKVSVLCLAYNHEKYIRKTLDGFINQKTNFRFEVLINDDCSTDATASIIKEYELKYPKIIIPFYQNKNLYSQGISIFRTIFYPKAKGKYFAICEGDDYWIDEKKLQMQYDYMETHKVCTCVATSYIEHNCGTNKDVIVRRSNKDRDLSLEEVVNGDGDYLATATLFCKREIFISRPEAFNSKYFGDYQIPIYAALLGELHYINIVTTQYNYHSNNSWTFNNNNKKSMMIIKRENIRLLNAINEYYHKKYNDIFSSKIKMNELEILALDNKYKDIKNDNYYNKNKGKFSKSFNSKVLIGSFNSKLLEIILNIKRKLIK